MKNNYLVGILGGLLGALLFTVPWILMYIYGNMIWSFLAIIVAWGALKGYQMFKGKEDKSLPYIICIVSIIAITISVLIICPLIMMAQNEIPLSMENFTYVYSLADFKSAIFKDYAFSLLFTALGLSSVLSTLRRQIGQKKVQLFLGKNPETINYESELIKSTFEKCNAFDKNHAIFKEEILSTMGEKYDGDLHAVFNQYYRLRIIKKIEGKYYFDLKTSESKFKKFSLVYGSSITVFIFIVLFVIIFSLI